MEKDKKFKEASNKKNMIDLEQKLKFMTTEMKRQEARADKLSEQMRKIIDAKIGFANGADIYQNNFQLTNEVKDEKRFYKYIPEQEYMEMVKLGFEDQHRGLLKEREILKDCLLET